MNEEKHCGNACCAKTEYEPQIVASSNDRGSFDDRNIDAPDRSVVADGSAPRRDYLMPVSIVVSTVILAGAWVYTSGPRGGTSAGGGSALGGKTAVLSETTAQGSVDPLEEIVLPSGGVYIPVRWGDLGKKMVAAGVIDRKKFEELYAARGGLSKDMLALLDGTDVDRITITQANSGEILNLLWALGLGNKNRVLDEGPMQDPKYGGAGKFASTGGWTLAVGDAMDHYSKHAFITLTPEQQASVERVAQGIFRPCCGNSTYFPDCNHGMAMLGLLELMASQGVSEANMYRAALAVNSYWFPETYLTIAKYYQSKGIDWKDAKPEEALSAQLSSASGYRQLQQSIQPVTPKSGGGGCGV